MHEVVVVWKISTLSQSKQDWGQPRPLYFPDQMLAVMVSSQHRVSSFKTIRLCAPCDARCMRHAIRTSAVCSMTPHSQFGKEARPYLCMDEWNLSISVCIRLRLTQAVRDKLNLTGLVLVMDMKTRTRTLIVRTLIVYVLS